MLAGSLLTADSSMAQHAPLQHKTAQEAAHEVKDAMACPEVFAHPVYDSVTQMSYALCDIHHLPTDMQTIAYGRDHNIFFADNATLLVDAGIGLPYPTQETEAERKKTVNARLDALRAM